MKKRSSILIILLIGSIFQICLSQKEAEIQSILDDEVFQYAQVAVAARALDDGAELIGVNDDIALIPASSLKLITTLSAIDILGPDFQYRTDIVLDGELDAAGTWHGDLIIKGAGDPTLATSEMEVPTLEQIFTLLLEKLNKKGIKCIDGNIIMDQSRFGPHGVGHAWPWDDLSNYYAAGIYGINVHENQYKVYLQQQSREGEAVSVDHIDPTIRGLRIDSKVKTGAQGSGDNAYIYGDPYGYDYWITGTIPSGKRLFDIKGAMPSPARHLGMEIKRYLEDSGVITNDVIVSNRPMSTSNIENLFFIKSPKLSKIVAEANKVSNNLYCEALLRTIVEGHGVEADDGIDRVMEHMSDLGLESDALQMDDGSGLSPFNRITPALFADFLVAREKGDMPISHQLMPRAGIEGTVKYLRIPKTLHNKVFMKSGSITGVLTYTGWIQAQSERWIAFSFMCNGHTVSNRQIRPKVVEIIENIHDRY